MEAPVHVAWIFDDNVALEASVAITSVVAHADPGRQYILHLLVFEVDETRLAAIAELADRNIRFCIQRLPALSFASPALAHATQMQLERLALGRLLPDVGRVVYLDTDLVVCRDISNLYDIDLEGSPIGAVVDLHIERQFRLRRKAGSYTDLADYFETTLSLPKELQGQYFNTGVLLLDLDTMRVEGLEQRIRAALASGLKLLIPDQCVLNMLMLPRAKLLDSRWNVLVPSTRFALLAKRTPPDKKRWHDFVNPFVLHFAGGKPWRHRARPKASHWWVQAMASPLYREIISSFWASRGRNKLATLRSKAFAPLQMAVARQRIRKRPRTTKSV